MLIKSFSATRRHSIIRGREPEADTAAGDHQVIDATVPSADRRCRRAAITSTGCVQRGHRAPDCRFAKRRRCECQFVVVVSIRSSSGCRASLEQRPRAAVRCKQCRSQRQQPSANTDDSISTRQSPHPTLVVVADSVVVEFACELA